MRNKKWYGKEYSSRSGIIKSEKKVTPRRVLPFLRFPENFPWNEPLFSIQMANGRRHLFNCIK